MDAVTRAAAVMEYMESRRDFAVDLLRRLGDHFGLHPLVLEDIVNTGQRPKFEDHGDYLYIGRSGAIELVDEHGQLCEKLGVAVLEFDGQRIEDDEHLINVVGFTPIGKEVEILVFRNGEMVRLRTKVDKRQISTLRWS